MKSCLIVDDSGLVRRVARAILEKLDFTDIGEAENGQVALDACRAKMPDAILLDWNMPIMDGLEFLKHLRAAPNGTLPKVVFCTSENTGARIQEALSAGADEYIMKPFDREIMQSKLVQVGLLEAD
jgi:two-component system chemotaxis response regulator CheY